MIGRGGSVWRGVAVACAFFLFSAAPTLACAVCFGDPDSKMAKGVVAGVFTLVGVVAAVLVGVAGTSVFWMQRSRRLRQLENIDTPPEG